MISSLTTFLKTTKKDKFRQNIIVYKGLKQVLKTANRLTGTFNFNWSSRLVIKEQRSPISRLCSGYSCNTSSILVHVKGVQHALIHIYNILYMSVFQDLLFRLLLTPMIEELKSTINPSTLLHYRLAAC